MTVCSGQEAVGSKKTRWRKPLRDKIFHFALCVMLLVVSVPVEAQRAEKVYRICWLGPTDPGNGEGMAYVKPFLDQLRQLGWVEGRHFAMEYRSPEGKSGRVPTLAAELVRLKADVIVTITTEAAMAAKKATTTIPIVMGGASRPVRRGLVASLARPGGNVTGLAHNPGRGFSSKQYQILKETAPRISRVAHLQDTRSSRRKKDDQEKTSRQRVYDSLGSTRLDVEVRGADFAGAFARIRQLHADALIVSPNQVMFEHRKRVVDFANTHRLPTLFGAREFVEIGGLMSYYADWIDLKRRAAVYVDKILKGRKPADLPVERPSKFELVINLKTAKQLGLTIPPEVLYRADKVIK